MTNLTYPICAICKERWDRFHQCSSLPFARLLETSQREVPSNEKNEVDSGDQSSWTRLG